jgi:hypothetical protein
LIKINYNHSFLLAPQADIARSSSPLRPIWSKDCAVASPLEVIDSSIFEAY